MNTEMPKFQGIIFRSNKTDDVMQDAGAPGRGLYKKQQAPIGACWSLYELALAEASAALLEIEFASKLQLSSIVA